MLSSFCHLISDGQKFASWLNFFTLVKVTGLTVGQRLVKTSV